MVSLEYGPKEEEDQKFRLEPVIVVCVLSDCPLVYSRRTLLKETVD